MRRTEHSHKVCCINDRRLSAFIECVVRQLTGAFLLLTVVGASLIGDFVGVFVPIGGLNHYDKADFNEFGYGGLVGAIVFSMPVELQKALIKLA